MENKDLTKESKKDEEKLPFFSKLIKTLSMEDNGMYFHEKVNQDYLFLNYGKGFYNVERNTLSDFADLVQVLNYSEDQTTKRKEAFLFQYLVNFFSLQQFFIQLSDKMRSCLKLYVQIDDDSYKKDTQDFLVAIENNSSHVFIKRTDFKVFLLNVQNIIDEFLNLFCSLKTIFYDLKTMILCYNEEERLKKLLSDLALNKNKDGPIETKKSDFSYHSEKTNSQENNNEDKKNSLSLKKKRVKKNKSQALKMLNKFCSHCSTSETSEWRKGPNGLRTLCNACGLFYSKLSRKFNPEIAAMIFEYKKKTDTVLNRMIPSGKSSSNASDLNFFFNNSS